jgi:TatD DNase family protein
MPSRVRPPTARPALVDSHVHLDQYPPHVLKAMLARARLAGVRRFLSVGVDVASSATAVELASRYRGVLAAIGIHPKHVQGLKLAGTMARLDELACEPKVAAVGEVGLDETVGGSPNAQESFFGVFLDMATKLDLPVVLHVVGAHERAQAMLSQRYPQYAVVHYFQGDLALAEAYLDLGCYISVGRPVTRSNRPDLREAVRRIPLDRLMLETDTYPLPGRATEPRDVAAICQVVAELRDDSVENVARATTANFRRLFGPRRAGLLF